MAWRPKTRQEFGRILCVDVIPVFGDRQPGDVKRGEVRAVADQLAERAPVMANRVFEVTRRLYTWAIGKDLVETSPCVGLSKPSLETQRHLAAYGQEDPQPRRTRRDGRLRPPFL